MLVRDGVGCEQSHISGTGWSAGMSLGSLLLVHISNSSTLLCLLGTTYCNTSSCPVPHPVISSICLSSCHLPFFNLLSTEALHSLFILPKSRAGSAVYSLIGWPVQWLGDNQIAFVCPRGEWKHSFCPLCSFSFS